MQLNMQCWHTVHAHVHNLALMLGPADTQYNQTRFDRGFTSIDAHCMYRDRDSRRQRLQRNVTHSTS